MSRSPYFRNPTYTDFKESVRVASTASVNINSPGASIDGVVLTYGDTVLLKDQGIGADNGLYMWKAPNLPMVRSAGGIDHQISSGMLVPVEEGTVNADKIFMLTTDEPIETGETALVFEEFGASADLSGYAELGANNAWTGTNEFTTITRVLDSNIGFLETGDTEPKLAVNSNGTLEFSDGTAAPDVTLYRDGVGIIRTSADLTVDGSLNVPTDSLSVDQGDFYLGGLFTHQRTVGVATTDVNYQTYLDGDVESRFVLYADGKMGWGDGTTTHDVTLARTLGGDLEVTTTAGDLIFFPGGDTVFNQTATFNEPVDMNSNVSLGDGPTRTIGFYGATAVPQAAAIAAAPTQTASYVQADVQAIADSLNDVITALQNIGITA